jgi:hypothetical protein
LVIERAVTLFRAASLKPTGEFRVAEAVALIVRKMVVLLMCVEVPQAKGSFISLEVTSHDHPLSKVVNTCALADPADRLQAVRLLENPHTASTHEVTSAKQILEKGHVGRLCGAMQMPTFAGLEQPQSQRLRLTEFLQCVKVLNGLEVREATSARFARRSGLIPCASLKSNETRLGWVIADAIAH